MKKMIIFNFLSCFMILTAHADDLANQEFKLIFANKKILHAYREKGQYDLICSEYADQGKNRPANFYYNPVKNTISFIYMERNEYPIKSIKKLKNDFVVSLRDGDLNFKVHKINDHIYSWNQVPNESLDTMYTLFYKNDWSELKADRVVNSCKNH